MEKSICRECGHDESKCSFDEVIRRAEELISHKGKASAALLQKDLKISYAKSIKALELLEDKGLIGPIVRQGQPREVFLDQSSK